MARPKGEFSKTNRITIRVSENDLKSLYSVKKSGDFNDDSESIRFCITFTSIVLNMIPAAIAETFIETAESSLKEIHHTGRNGPDKTTDAVTT